MVTTSYAVHSTFLTLQGEGANLGRLAVFIRFAGCNLWSGREHDRLDAACRFCDTEFVGGVRYTREQLVEAAAKLWPEGEHRRLVVLTGGEPLLQVDDSLVRALCEAHFSVAVETNGTKQLPAGVHWVCVSPKAGVDLVLSAADELKLVYPQEGAEPDRFASFSAVHKWLSPMDGPNLKANIAAAVGYCRANPMWRLNVQAHKVWGIA